MVSCPYAYTRTGEATIFCKKGETEMTFCAFVYYCSIEKRYKLVEQAKRCLLRQEHTIETKE